jgi:hypothetical protein
LKPQKAEVGHLRAFASGFQRSFRSPFRVVSIPALTRRRDETAVKLIALGGALILLPMFLGNSPIFKAFSGFWPLGLLLLELVAKRSPEQQQALLNVALEGEYWRPTCVNCGVKMVSRSPRNGGKDFWGCVNYPRCKTTLPMRGALER